MYKIEKMNKNLLAFRVEEGLMNYILQEPIEIGERIPNEFELPEKIREELANGKYIENQEELYGFLENYSS